MTVTIEPLHCGDLTAARSSFEQGASDTSTRLPVPAWLIRHPDGIVLFDTGMHDELSRDTPLLEMVSTFFAVTCTADDLIATRLAGRDVDAADVDVVVASHLHFDHIGGLAQLPNARLVVQATEWAAGIDDELAAANFFRRDEFDLGHDRVLADGVHDVFGDGRIECLPTPGHTPGHQSLVVRLDSGEVVLCGDCAYFESTLGGGPLPPIGHDQAAQADSIAELVRRRVGGAHVIPGHDADVFAALPDTLT